MADAKLTPGQLAAKVQVTQINKQRGYLPEVYANLEPETRRVIEQTVLQVDKEYGPATLALVDRLYAGTSVNPISELLDNAFSSSYKKATERGNDPYVSFELSQDRLIVEYNEDGFSSDDLQSICSVERGTRKSFHKQDTLGFKSVFTVAWKAHIQSNDLSFAFTHRKGDSGLGLISPIWQDPADNFDHSLTRITLFLGTQEESTARELTYNAIASQLKEICHTALLDDNPIKRISISTCTTKGASPSTTVFVRHGNDPVLIKMQSVSEGVESSYERRYHVFHHRFQNDPRSENPVQNDKGSQVDAPTLLTLMFCLDDSLAPRPLNFDDLTYWDKDPNGRVLDSERNQAISDQIPIALVEAIQKFCLHPTLRFQWMRWLPQPDDRPDLVSKIKPLLESIKVLQTHSGQLECISKLRRIKTIFDIDGNPLFGGNLSFHEVYLAKQYESADLELLKAYGLQSLSWEEAIELAEVDLLQPQLQRCRMKNPKTTQEWHTCAAQTLMKLYTTACKPETPQRLKKFKSLGIIPLTNGRWVSSESGPLYYSQCLDQISIPDNLGYSLVDPKASNNNHRRKLFDSLGVTELDFSEVRSRILSATGPNGVSIKQIPTLQSSIDGLKFLYQTDLFKSNGESHESLRKYCVLDQHSHVSRPFQEDLYISSSDSQPPNIADGASAQRQLKFARRCLHPQYLIDGPKTPPDQQLDWPQWLQCTLGLVSDIRLTQVDSTGDVQLSAAFRYLLKYWPDRVVDFLHTTWPGEGEIVKGSPSILKELRSICVPSTAGSKHLLSDMYLPVGRYQECFSRYVDTEVFQFLDIAVRPTEFAYCTKWRFLMAFLGVRYLPSLDSCLRAFCCFSSSREYGPSEISSMLDLCEAVQQHCKTSKDAQSTKNYIRQFFKESNARLPPLKRIQWTSARETSISSLTSYTQSPLSRSPRSWKVLKEFYTSTLQLQYDTWRDLLEELRRLSGSSTTGGLPDFEWIIQIYSTLTQLWAGFSSSDRESLRSSFMSDNLVYVPSAGKNRWCTIRSCFWSSIPLIQGKVLLVDIYPNLQEFFVDILNVPTSDLQTLCDAIMKNGLIETPLLVSEAKTAIWKINDIFESTTIRPSPKPLQDAEIFPVKSPGVLEVKLHTATAEFMVPDRRNAYEFQVKRLDFTLGEVLRLKPLLEWLGLGHAFFSSMVTEVFTAPMNNKKELHDIDRSIKEKANGLLRFAVHFESPRSRKNKLELDCILRNSKIYEVETISSTSCIDQGGQKFSHANKQCEFHIREDPGVADTLKVFVPRDSQRQRLSYLSNFPRGFLKWLMTDPASSPSVYTINEEALRILTSILNAPAALVPRILYEEGIIEMLPAGSSEKYGDGYVSKGQYADAPTTPQKKPPPPHRFNASDSSNSILGAPMKESSCPHCRPTLSPFRGLNPKLPSRSTNTSPVAADSASSTPFRGFTTPSSKGNWPTTPPQTPPKF